MTKFRDFGDPVLRSMRRETLAFMAHLRTLPRVERPAGRWLSFVGTSGTGKTMLADVVLNYWRDCAGLFKRPDCGAWCFRDGAKIHWPKLQERLKSGRFNISESLQEIVEKPFVVLDDIGATADKSGFMADVLHTLISQRIGLPTMLTSNLTLEQLGQVDARVSSRLIRDDNVCMEIKAVDYALRPDRTK